MTSVQILAWLILLAIVGRFLYDEGRRRGRIETLSKLRRMR